MTITQAMLEYARLLEICNDDPETATTIERDIATAALLAIDSGDVPRAQGLARIALDIQQVRFRRM